MMTSLGGSKIFTKRKAKLNLPYAPDNNHANVYIYSPHMGTEEPRGRVSMFKRISYALPGNQSKKASGKQRSRSANPIQRTQPSSSWERDAPPVPNGPFGVPQFGFGSQSDVMDITHDSSRVNLHRLTPRSSEDSDSFERHLTSLSARSILPFSSTHTISFSDRTAVQDSPAPHPFPSGPGVLDQVTPASSLPRRTLTRARSFSDSSRLPGVHFSAPRPQTARSETSQRPSTLSQSAKKPRPLSTVISPSATPTPYKRARRITLDAGTLSTPSRTSFTHPYSTSMEVKSHDRELHSPTSTRINADHPILALQDPFSNLFTSCAISLFLLIVLAAGKDVLYVIALLPVLMALARHSTEIYKTIAVGPLMKKNLENLISL